MSPTVVSSKTDMLILLVWAVSMGRMRKKREEELSRVPDARGCDLVA
jgi:hypothetical protein